MPRALSLMLFTTAIAVASLSGRTARAEADDPCESVTCSGHGMCLVRDGEAMCACRHSEGYVEDHTGLSCVPKKKPRVEAPPRSELGESISVGRYIVGGLMGTVLGFGIGHAINLTYPLFGHIFTAGEIVGSAIATMFTIVSLLEGGAMEGVFVGLGIFGALRLWEMVDVWVRGTKRLPSSAAGPRNRRVVVLPVPVALDAGAGVGVAGSF